MPSKFKRNDQTTQFFISPLLREVQSSISLPNGEEKGDLEGKGLGKQHQKVKNRKKSEKRLDSDVEKVCHESSQQLTRLVTTRPSVEVVDIVVGARSIVYPGSEDVQIPGVYASSLQKKKASPPTPGQEYSDKFTAPYVSPASSGVGTSGPDKKPSGGDMSLMKPPAFADQYMSFSSFGPGSMTSAGNSVTSGFDYSKYVPGASNRPALTKQAPSTPDEIAEAQRERKHAALNREMCPQIPMVGVFKPSSSDIELPKKIFKSLIATLKSAIGENFDHEKTPPGFWNGEECIPAALLTASGPGQSPPLEFPSVTVVLRGVPSKPLFQRIENLQVELDKLKKLPRRTADVKSRMQSLTREIMELQREVALLDETKALRRHESCHALALKSGHLTPDASIMGLHKHGLTQHQHQHQHLSSSKTSTKSIPQKTRKSKVEHGDDDEGDGDGEDPTERYLKECMTSPNDDKGSNEEVVFITLRPETYLSVSHDCSTGNYGGSYNPHSTGFKLRFKELAFQNILLEQENTPESEPNGNPSTPDGSQYASKYASKYISSGPASGLGSGSPVDEEADSEALDAQGYAKWSSFIGGTSFMDGTSTPYAGFDYSSYTKPFGGESSSKATADVLAVSTPVRIQRRAGVVASSHAMVLGRPILDSFYAVFKVFSQQEMEKPQNGFARGFFGVAPVDGCTYIEPTHEPKPYSQGEDLRAKYAGAGSQYSKFIGTADSGEGNGLALPLFLSMEGKEEKKEQGKVPISISTPSIPSTRADSPGDALKNLANSLHRKSEQHLRSSNAKEPKRETTASEANFTDSTVESLKTGIMEIVNKSAAKQHDVLTKIADGIQTSFEKEAKKDQEKVVTGEISAGQADENQRARETVLGTLLSALGTVSSGFGSFHDTITSLTSDKPPVKEGDWKGDGKIENYDAYASIVSFAQNPQ